jgi:hypothetical protein
VNIKQNLKDCAQTSPFYLTVPAHKSGEIARYSDKRKNGGKKNGVGWSINWNYFPRELRVGKRAEESKRRLKRTGKKSLAASVKGNQLTSKKSSKDVSDDSRAKKRRRVTFDEDGSEGLVKKLDSLEKAEQSSADSEQSGEEENVEEVYDEYEDEEGTDYNLTYFDNGEDYDVGGDDEALEEGPVY